MMRVSQDIASQIGELVSRLGADLAALREVGGEIPAVERNALRMQGTLRALRIQFEDLTSAPERAV